VEQVEAQDGFWTEIRTSFELYRSLSDRVRVARQAGTFPLILAGNCASALGTVSGARTGDIGIFWFDAHGDFNTPETTTGGFVDGMGLAMLTGACWTRLTASIPGFRAVPGNHVVHVGARDLDEGEGERMQEAGIAVVGAAALAQQGVHAALAHPLIVLLAQVREVYLHLDLDVLDPQEVPANEYQPEGGMALSDLEEAVRLIGQRFDVSAAAVTAYDPARDPDNRAIRAVSRIVGSLAATQHRYPRR
jgi:arginase